MLLNPNEQLVISEQVETGPGGSNHDGTLFLTNMRLLFEGKVGKGPMGGAVPVTLLNVNLSAVSNVFVQSQMFGRPLIRIETKMGAYSFRTKNAQAWSDKISAARSQAPPPPPKAPPPPPPATQPGNQPIVIHLHQENGPPSVYLHCTHCGTLNAPGTGRCKSCGGTL